MNVSKPVPWCLLCAALAMLGGCCLPDSSSRRQSSSLVSFLYPRGMEQPDRPAIPILSLPLHVGVAWVPEQGDSPTHRPGGQLTESQKIELLHKVVPQFKSYEFVKSIEVIPSTYLTPGGGFANLDQIRAIHGVDVMALVSYDQVQFTDEGLLSLAYWTVVGAYVVQGERNDTQTMVDTAVYDIASRKLLFRAPGTSRIKASSTPINQTEELRRDARRGFDQATTNMVANLQDQLASFRERVKQSPDEFKVVRKPGYTGAGHAGLAGVLLAAMLGLVVLRPERNRRP
jgi:rhombotail lipoprotein